MEEGREVGKMELEGYRGGRQGVLEVVKHVLEDQGLGDGVNMGSEVWGLTGPANWKNMEMDTREKEIRKRVLPNLQAALVGERA